MTRATQHAHQHHSERHRDGEGVARRHIVHEERMDATGQPRQRTRDGKGHQLVAQSGHTHHFGHVFVVMNGEQSNAQLGRLNAPGNEEGRHRARQGHQVDRR